MDLMMPLLLLGILVSLAAGVFVFLRWRKPKQEAVYYFRCPRCRIKLHYYARQAGHQVVCNSCKEKFTFPPPPHRAR
jgi:hypothetical protein